MRNWNCRSTEGVVGDAVAHHIFPPIGCNRELRHANWWFFLLFAMKERQDLSSPPPPFEFHSPVTRQYEKRISWTRKETRLTGLIKNQLPCAMHVDPFRRMAKGTQKKGRPLLSRMDAVHGWIAGQRAILHATGCIHGEYWRYNDNGFFLSAERVTHSLASSAWV